MRGAVEELEERERFAIMGSPLPERGMNKTRARLPRAYGVAVGNDPHDAHAGVRRTNVRNKP
jgi:hypothetical protein